MKELIRIIDEFDQRTLRILNIPNPFFNSIALFLIYSMYFLFFLNFYFLLIEKRTKKLKKYFKTSVLGCLMVYSLKYLINRPRPSFKPLLEKFDPSFPSSHAFFSAILIHFSKEKIPIFLKIPSLLFGILTPFLVIYIGIHYPSDSVAGFLLGYYFPTFLSFIEEKITKTIKEAKNGKKLKLKK